MAWKRRIARDMKDLVDNDFEVIGENGKEHLLNEFLTTVTGPVDSPY